jgi:glycosyltransferase involved in cell wall biosynthesis
VPRSPSLILASYNQPNSLALVFEGILTQTRAIGELLIADDGSEEDTRYLVESFARRAAFPVIFTTQPDSGFRKARAQNNAIRESSGRHLLFLDGDCVPPPRWVERYVAALEAGADFAVSGVASLSPDRSQALGSEQISAGRIDELCSDADRRHFRSVHRREFLYRIFRKPRKPRIKGGNWAATRNSLFAVNGFDEKFDGFGKEDSDIRNRLRNSGFQGRSLWNTNWVYHCSHELDPRRTRPDAIRNPPDLDYVESRRHSKTCRYGITRPSTTEVGAQSDPLIEFRVHQNP